MDDISHEFDGMPLRVSINRSIGLKYRVPDRRERFKSSLELQLLILCHKVLLTNYLAREVKKLVVLMLNSPLSLRDQEARVSID